MAELTFHGHACFQLEAGDGKRLLFDPFLDHNPAAKIGSGEIDQLDYILVSHGHFDHFGEECLKIAKKTGAEVISTLELVAFCEQRGVKNGHGMNLGGGHHFPFGRVKLTQAVHTGSVAGDDEGAFTTDCCGFLLTLNSGQRLYFAGDTALTMDMGLLRGQVDVALLPIGDYFTMGPEDAARAVEMIEPKTVIPMHYNTWPPIEQDPEEFRRLVAGRAEVRVLEPGESWQF
ncbi:MAG: metal-dependent hydrolase [Longimicrobiaceae bacterium]